MTQLTLEELEVLNEERKLESRRRYLSISLNICPTCGANIIEERYEVYDKPFKMFFGLIQIKGKKWDVRMLCSKDKTHYEIKYNCEEMGY